MKNWIPLMLFAGAVAGDAGDLPEGGVKQPVVNAALVRASNVHATVLSAGTADAGVMFVCPEDKDIVLALRSPDDSAILSLSLRGGEPQIYAIKGKSSVTIPLFALAEHLGIQPQRVAEADSAKGDQEN